MLLDPTDVRPHPLADVLPFMTETELCHLIDDVEVHGQVEPVVTWVDEDGVEYLLDGRHRAAAARRLSRPLSARRFVGSAAQARALVLSLNVRRRHLTPSQRALAAGALATRVPGGQRASDGDPANLPVQPTQAEAARAAGVSERSVRDAALVVRSGLDDLVDAVAAGRLSVSAAAQEIRNQGHADRRAATALYMEHRRSSSSDVWLTPQWVVERSVACLGGIDVDVAAEAERGIPARRWITEEDDALAAQSWGNFDGTASRVWLNPPYGGAGRRGPGEWTRRLVHEWRSGRVHSALMLLPARPGARWQQELSIFPRVEFSDHLEFVPGVGNPARERWATGAGRHQAQFASILVGVGLEPADLAAHFGDVGVVWVRYPSTPADPSRVQHKNHASPTAGG
ncbi:DNA N-6-adenine-methyltransferase [uncultured Microbacterium sp.]|uniref:DNA N-6-adenine-methyltransferase n=1 Tax=uncultured Microbacterium sp. TaxID=191216 RepID=UPI0025DE5CCA|nr:DNA N-6-adenine-methyltransferase [uncultured Microbacterium sp.]